MKFEELQLPAYLVEGLKKQDITEATDIQAKCIPAIREGRDVVGTSQTGSGKTYAFGLPALCMVDGEPAVQVLVVCPTRELTAQVCEELRKLTNSSGGLKLLPIYGGSSMEKQIASLKKGARIVVGTPGRLMDHLRRKTLKLGSVKLVVLDEADEMLDMGFRDDIETILTQTNSTHQTVMFSATFPKEILQLSKKYMKDPIELKSDTHGQAQTFIEQHYISVPKNMKNMAVAHILSQYKPERAIIFCNMKSMVDSLCESLTGQGIVSVGLHGDMRQSERRRSMAAIKENRIPVLIATDVAARGIDIKNVDLIINFDIPNQNDFYIHRIGRTARAGKTGVAFSIVTGRDQLLRIEELKAATKNEIPEYVCKFSVSYAQKNAAAKASFGRGGFDKKVPEKKGFTRKKDFTDKNRDKEDSFRRDKADAFSPRKSRDAKPDTFSPTKSRDTKPDAFSPTRSRDTKSDGFSPNKSRDIKPDGFSPNKGRDTKPDAFSPKKNWNIKPDGDKKARPFEKNKKKNRDTQNFQKKYKDRKGDR